MGYILGLILMLGFIFSSISGTDFVGGLWKNLVSKIGGFAFPKTQNEIVIENLETQYSNLNKLISSVAPSILGSNTIAPEEKESVKQAMQIIEESQNTIGQLKNIQTENRSVPKALLEKVFKLVPILEPSPSPNPTQTPLNCNNAI